MSLLKSWSSIITLSGGVVVMFLMRRIKYSTIYETLKEKIINWKNNNFRIPELPNPNWIKIGKVKDLHIHPLASGDRIRCSKLKFTPYGAFTEHNGLVVQDKMFHIYNEKTKQFQNTHTRTAIQLVSADMLNESQVQFSLAKEKVIIDIDKEAKDTRKIVKELRTSWIVVRYIDCGEKAAEWLNSTLTTSNLRILQVEYDIIDESIMEKDLIKEKNADDEAWELFLNLTGYTMVTLNSMAEFIFNTQQYYKIQPHVIISAPSSPIFAETNWEWIRIGNIIMKRIMPVSNLTSVQESFKKDKYHHPPKFLGIFYGLYTTGDANINDDVYVHISQNDTSNNAIAI